MAKAYDAAGNVGTSAPVTVTVLSACAPLRFTTTLTSQQTVIALQHFVDLRDDVNAVRARASLGAFNWTAPAPAAQQPVRAQHLIDLRNNLKLALDALQQPITFTDGTATSLPANTRIKAIHLVELRTAIQAACGS
jgi:hypothetical protein